MKKGLLALGVLVILVAGSFMAVRYFPSINGVSDVLFIPVLIASALVDSVNPCALSVLLITVAFLGSLGATRTRILSLGFSYIFGIFAIYLMIGLGLLKALDIFGVPNMMGKIGAGILLFFGLSNILAHYFPNFPIEFKIPQSAHQKLAPFIAKASLPAVFVLGALVALFEFPCTGGPYLMVLGLLHDGANYLKGVGYLLIYNLIFVLPLVILLFVASEKSLIEKVEAWKKHAAGEGKVWGGIAMIILAIVIFLVS